MCWPAWLGTIQDFQKLLLHVMLIKRPKSTVSKVIITFNLKLSVFVCVCFALSIAEPQTLFRFFANLRELGYVLEVIQDGGYST